MAQHHRALIGLTVAQICCLACGLWIQDRFVIASARWSAKQEQAAIEGTDPEAVTDASDEEPPLSADGLLSAMPFARAMAMLWIGGIQIGIAYLVVVRFQTDSSENRMQSTRELMRRERELLRTRNAVVFGLAKLAEYRDQDTGQHLERIALYSTRLAVALRRDERFRHYMTPTFVKTIGISSALHDIGKVAIEDSILCKPGKLTADERKRMQQHTLLAGECIREIERHLGNSNFLQMAREIALCHHERWDGEGYPLGLAERDVPLAARIVSIADIYDALSVKRVYKEAYDHERCVEMIRAEAGKQLDPSLVEVFLKIETEFREIRQRFADAKKNEDQRGEIHNRSPNRPGKSQDVSETLAHSVSEIDELSETVATAG